MFLADPDLQVPLCFWNLNVQLIYVGLSPLPVTVTTSIITFLVGDPYKPSFTTVTGRGDNPRYMGVSKNRVIPKWMVKILENPMKMDDLGVPLFLETSI